MRRKKREGDGYSYICAICEDFGELLLCERCRQGFHLACIGLSSCPDGDSWLCNDCSQNKVRCFDCKEYGRFKETAYRCGVGLCGKIYHDHCIKQWDKPQPKSRSAIVCPHHYCDVCWNGQSNYPGKDNLYKCLKCPTAYHEICIPDGAGLLEDIPGFLLCARHNEGWKCQNDGNAPTEFVKVAFERLPLPSVPQDFKLPMSLKASVKRSLSRPAPYVHIRRNIYRVKRPRKKAGEENTQCSCHALDGSTGSCDKDCLCGILFTSCSSSCKCGDACANLPFQKRPVKKLKAVKTQNCGWGLKADEDVRAGEFLVEYVGEVIDDEMCEKRLWAMKEKGESNFYMCEISREMVIDATFKGNLSRFINHSCSPNGELQKWEIEGEIRIGVFAKQNIKKGEYVSYDYQFIQFGTDQLCHCGAVRCRRQLGKPHKQKVVAETPLKSTRREALLTRPSRSSKPSRSFSIERGFSPINRVFRPQKTSVGEALKVVRADVHVQPEDRNNRVGLRVRVWWPLDQKFYHGKIVSYDPTIGRHQIMYDDGQEEDLHMAKERWEVEETKPSRPKRSRSPALREKNDKAHVVPMRRGLSPALDENSSKTRVFRRRSGRSSVLVKKSGEPMVSEPNGEAARILDLKHGPSCLTVQRGGKSPMLETSRTQPTTLEEYSSEVLPMEWRRTRPRISRRSRGQPSVFKKHSSESPVLEGGGSNILIACENATKYKENSSESPALEGGGSNILITCENAANESPELEGGGSNILIPCENATKCKEDSSESPGLQGDGSNTLIVCEDDISCKETSSEASVVTRDRTNTPTICKENSRESPTLILFKEKNSVSSALEENRGDTPILGLENSSESPAPEWDRRKTLLLCSENSSESPVLEGERRKTLILCPENSSESPALEGSRRKTLILCSESSIESPVLEGDRRKTLILCPENSIQSPALEGTRRKTLILCPENSSESLALEEDKRKALILCKENNSVSPALEENRRDTLTLSPENSSESPALEADRRKTLILCPENSSESSSLEGDRRKTLILCDKNGSESPTVEVNGGNTPIVCARDTRWVTQRKKRRQGDTGGATNRKNK